MKRPSREERWLDEISAFNLIQAVTKRIDELREYAALCKEQFNEDSAKGFIDYMTARPQSEKPSVFFDGQWKHSRRLG